MPPLPLRVATIILPQTADERNVAAHAQLIRNLMAHWGGYTQFHVTGAWRDEVTGVTHHDGSQRYDVAMVDTFTNRTTFRAIARVAGMEADQLSVFVTYPSGEVELIEVDNSEENDRRTLSYERHSDDK